MGRWLINGGGSLPCGRRSACGRRSDRGRPPALSRPLTLPPFLLQYVGAPVAYIQQIFVKSSVSPWHKNLLAVDVFRSPLSRAFQLVEEIRNHVLRDRYPSEGPRNPILNGREGAVLSVTPLRQFSSWLNKREG